MTPREAAAPLLAVLPAVAWLPHKLVRKPDGHLDKPPCEGARTNDPSTWFTFDAAMALLTGQNDVAGIGFAVTAGVITFDFDHCRDPVTGQLADEVQREVERLESYTYTTPSLTGIRVVGTNDPGHPVPGGKSVRWLPGGHRVEIFVGPTSHYNTLTADVLPGYETLRDISEETLDYLSGLDGGRQPADAASNPDPQRSIGAIVAALAAIANTTQDWDAWSRIGMAAWRASGGRGAGLDAWMTWSARHPCHDPRACEERWQHWFSSPPTRLGFGTLYYEARRFNPLFVAPFDPAEEAGRADDGPLPFEAVKPSPLRSLREILALPPQKWLIEGLIPENSLIVPYGPPKAGKTFVMLSAGLHVAAERDWFGHATRPGAVVYILGEGAGGVSTRLRAMLTRYDMSPDIPFYVINTIVNLSDPAAVKALEAAIRERIGDTPLALIIIDTLARSMPGADENSAKETGVAIRSADQLREAFVCSVALVHHEGKDAERGARGTSALRGAWDAAFRIVGEGRRKVTLTVVDQKESEAGQVMRFAMEEISAGIGRSSLVPQLEEGAAPDDEGLDGGPGSSRRERERALPDQTMIALQTLRDLVADPRCRDVPWFPDKPASVTKGLEVEAWRREFYERVPSLGEEAKRKAFQRAVASLVRLRRVGTHGGWAWTAN